MSELVQKPLESVSVSSESSGLERGIPDGSPSDVSVKEDISMTSMGAGPSRSIAFLSVGSQVIRDDLIEGIAAGGVLRGAGSHGRAPARYSLRAVAGMAELSRAVFEAKEDYIVLSLRHAIIWDCHLADRVSAEIAALENDGVPWLFLCADGADHKGGTVCSAFFNFEPSLLPDRGRRIVVQSNWTLCVIRTASLREIGGRGIVPADLRTHLDGLVAAGYARGLASVFCSRLYPCLAEHRSLAYRPLDDDLAALDPAALLPADDARDLFPDNVSRAVLLRSWADALESSLGVRHAFSFVIRSLFRRPHLLRRCLISIEYLRSTLGVDAEIVLGTDAAEDLVQAEVALLRNEFPHLTFVVARSEDYAGLSRVRNLLAGISATTGSRVCIIDDDDYYAPQAVKCLEIASVFGCEELVIFDSQIIGERWVKASAKWHKEIVSYGACFEARSWATTLRATNSIPFCGVIHPGWFVREVARDYAYDFDLSEDFVFHLQCFAHPKRPPVRVIDGVAAYQSHRVGDDNVSNVEDRTDWVSDTGNGLFQLLFERGRTFEVVSGGEVHAGEVHLRSRVAQLEADLRRAETGRVDATRMLGAVIRQAIAVPR